MVSNAGDEPGSSYAALLQVMRRRRSVRRFRNESVPETLVDQVLEAARWAPSAGNRQSFRFLVVRSPSEIATLAEAVRTASAALAAKARPEQLVTLSVYLKSFEHFAGAPLLIAPIYRSGGPDLLQAMADGGQALTDARGPGSRSPLSRPAADALASVAAAIMNLLLAATALGLGSCWMTGPLLAESALQARLAVPDGWSVAALIPLGYPAETPEPPPRRPLAQLVRHLDRSDQEV